MTIPKTEAPDEFMCPLTLDVMVNPIVTKYGQSFERNAILEWLRMGHDVCPLSRRPLQLQDLVTNHGLRMKIEEWRRENGVEVPDDADQKPFNNLQIYGFVTLPTDKEGDEDWLYLHMALRRMGHAAPQPTEASEFSSTNGRRQRRQHQQRRATTGSSRTSHQSSSTSSRRRRSSMIRPFRGLKNLWKGDNRTATPPSA